MKKKKVRALFECVECSFTSPNWLGKCPGCESWNSLEEKTLDVKRAKKASNDIDISPLANCDVLSVSRTKTGIFEFDRVLGGGVVPGSLVLIGGEPGVGKSTLLLQVGLDLSEKKKVLYISGEESKFQVASRAKRLGRELDKLFFLNEIKFERIKSGISKFKPDFVILDSIQTTYVEELGSIPGSMSQIKEVTFELMNYAKSHNVSVLLVGHINKEGSLAGPKILEHMVDTVLYFEGDKVGQHRILRSAKNRFGSTLEVGLFEMTEKGVVPVNESSEYFLEGSTQSGFGRSTTCILEGNRSLFLEVQALVVENKFGNGRRNAQNFEANRLSMLVAVAEKYLDIALSFSDIYLNIVGGVKVKTGEADLSAIASIVSSHYKKELNPKWCFFGEVGLTGEIRPVNLLMKRIKEASQLKYERIYCSSMQKGDELDSIEGVVKLNHIDELMSDIVNS